MNNWIYHLLQSYKSTGLNNVQAILRVANLLGHKNLEAAGFSFSILLYLCDSEIEDE